MKKTITIREKIAVRAYYAWLNGSTAGHEADWHEAETAEIIAGMAAQAAQDALAWCEQTKAARRSAAAKKAAATRKAKAAAKAPAEMLVATTRRQTGRRPNAH